MAKTNFCVPSLADGRDLLSELLPEDAVEWRPSLNLYDLIMKLPKLIEKTTKLEKSSPKDLRSLGRFHLGLNYDMLIWLGNNQCRVFPCQ